VSSHPVLPPFTLWVLEFSCGPSGGYRLIVDQVHLNDVLADSGIKGPGDAAFIRPSGDDWEPSAFATRWAELSVDEAAVLEGTVERPGAVLSVMTASGRSQWDFRMLDSLWAHLVQEGVREIGFPAFNAR
jgi:hypothetical protein